MKSDLVEQFLSADAAAGGGSMMSMLLMFGAMFAIIYFVMIRPQQKQAKKHQELLNSLKKGDDVVLSSGILGKVYQVEDKTLQIEISKDVKLKVLKQAVSGLMASDTTLVEGSVKNS